MGDILSSRQEFPHFVETRQEGIEMAIPGIDIMEKGYTPRRWIVHFHKEKHKEFEDFKTHLLAHVEFDGESSDVRMMYRNGPNGKLIDMNSKTNCPKLIGDDQISFFWADISKNKKETEPEEQIS